MINEKIEATVTTGMIIGYALFQFGISFIGLKNTLIGSLLNLCHGSNNSSDHLARSDNLARVSRNV